MLARTESWWREWSGRCTYEGPHSEVVQRSLITLKALTYTPTGAIVAALTTSLPEEVRGERNWDYRFCWLRDGSFTLAPLVQAGYTDEAVAWRDWLFRAIAGNPSQLQIMYGIGGEHRLTELELPWLSGYEDSKPVRIGNAASEQFQLDIFGEVMAVLYGALEAGLPERDVTRSPGIDVGDAIDLVERMWRDPDEGIWEIRGQRQHFTYSKVAAWTAVDRAIEHADATGAEAPLDRWRAVRDEIHAEVLARGYDAERNTFRPVLRRERAGRELAAHLGVRISTPPTTRASWARSTRSSGRSATDHSSGATRHRRASTDLLAAKAPSSSARSGW